MLMDRYPGITVLPLNDYQDDRVWAQQIDSLLDPKHTWTGISGPDGFSKAYQAAGGQCDVMIHRQESPLSESTRRRQDIGEHLRIDNLDKRQALIWTAHNLHNQVFPTVDMVCVRDHGMPTYDNMIEPQTDVLVGRKKYEKLFRFPGGFVDLKDASLMDAAKREFYEEVKGIEVADWEYKTSMKIDDWRFKDTQGIMTTIFFCTYVFGKPMAGDDLQDVQWARLESLKPDLFVPAHRPIVEFVLRSL